MEYCKLSNNLLISSVAVCQVGLTVGRLDGKDDGIAVGRLLGREDGRDEGIGDGGGEL